jgi:sensor histidine kinase YesM
MALRNIRARLRLAYGEQATLVTHQDENTFFSVLTLPYVKSADR